MTIGIDALETQHSDLDVALLVGPCETEFGGHTKGAAETFGVASGETFLASHQREAAVEDASSSRLHARLTCDPRAHLRQGLVQLLDDVELVGHAHRTREDRGHDLVESLRHVHHDRLDATPQRPGPG